MRDAALAHFSRAVRDVHNNTHCMAFTLPKFESGFLLWRHLVYVASVDNEEALHHPIVNVCQTIRHYLGIFKRMRRSMMRRIEACIETHGEHYEHLL
jgi:hypothetical protein